MEKEEILIQLELSKNTVKEYSRYIMQELHDWKPGSEKALHSFINTIHLYKEKEYKLSKQLEELNAE